MYNKQSEPLKINALDFINAMIQFPELYTRGIFNMWIKNVFSVLEISNKPPAYRVIKFRQSGPDFKWVFHVQKQP